MADRIPEKSGRGCREQVLERKGKFRRDRGIEPVLAQSLGGRSETGQKLGGGQGRAQSVRGCKARKSAEPRLGLGEGPHNGMRDRGHGQVKHILDLPGQDLEGDGGAGHEEAPPRSPAVPIVEPGKHPGRP